MRRLWRFFKVGLWETDLRGRVWPLRALYSVLRVVMHVGRHYDRHQVGIRAAGLSMFSMLSVVPLMAIASGVADGLGYRAELREQIDRLFAELGEFADAGVYIQELVDQTRFRALGLMGSLVLAWTGLTMFVRVEEALNFAWRTSQSRGWLSRLSSFIGVLVLVPMLLIGALTATAALRSEGITKWLAGNGLGWSEGLYDAGLWAVPYGMSMAAFVALYKLMPSVQVSWRAALIAGSVTGVALLSMHELYVWAQFSVAQSNAIYGTLAALPLLLVYLQTVWTIVLLGAELGYAVQNLHRIGPGRDLETLSPATRELVGVRLVQEVAEQFAAGRGALSLGELASRLDVPVEWLDQSLTDLAEGGVLLPVRGGRAAPARQLEDLGLDAVASGVRGVTPVRLAERLRLDPRISEAIERARGAARDRLAECALAGTSRHHGTLETAPPDSPT